MLTALFQKEEPALPSPEAWAGLGSGRGSKRRDLGGQVCSTQTLEPTSATLLPSVTH